MSGHPGRDRRRHRVGRAAPGPAGAVAGAAHAELDRRPEAGVHPDAGREHPEDHRPVPGRRRGVHDRPGRRRPGDCVVPHRRDDRFDHRGRPDRRPGPHRHDRPGERGRAGRRAGDGPQDDRAGLAGLRRGATDRRRPGHHRQRRDPGPGRGRSTRCRPRCRPGRAGSRSPTPPAPTTGSPRAARPATSRSRTGRNRAAPNGGRGGRVRPSRYRVRTVRGVYGEARCCTWVRFPTLRGGTDPGTTPHEEPEIAWTRRGPPHRRAPTAPALPPPALLQTAQPARTR